MKCDETRPTCKICRRFGLDCAGYEVRITFTFEAGCEVVGGAAGTSENVASGRFRRPLFTERERKVMSDSLVQSVYPSNTNALLSLLDFEGAGIDENKAEKNVDILRGPFGLFKLDDTDPRSPPPPQRFAQEEFVPSSTRANMAAEDSPQARASRARASSARSSASDGVGAVFTSSCLDPIPEPSMDGDIQIPLPDNDMLMNALFPGGGLDIMLNDSMMAGQNQFQFSSMLNRGGGGEGSNGEDDSNATFQGQDSGNLLWGPMPPLSQPSQIPSDSATLLCHYRDVIVNLFSPLRHHRTPWQTMFLPNAISTVGRLSMGMPSNHASMCILYSLLAISALHLSRSITSDNPRRHWDARAAEYVALAQKELKLALQDESARPKRAKYKETLMSLISMISLSIFEGQWKHSRCYLLDTEKLIRGKGLTKCSKSRNVRSLHHCYAFMRVIHESTFIEEIDPPVYPSSPSSPDSPRPRILAAEDRSPLRVQKWDGRLDQRLAIKKAVAIGENDIHLGVPGRWDPTMYPSIYGVPEPLLVLLSETTRLANERDVLQRSPRDSNLTWPQYLFRAKVLEKCLCGWDPGCPSSYPGGWSDAASLADVASNQRLVGWMVLAMHQAVVIYFYRRIHDLDPMILQDRVSTVLRYLEDCRDMAGGDPMHTCSSAFAWTGFVAASEALKVGQQEAFDRWFRSCSKRSGIQTFEASRKAVEEVWARRRGADITVGNASWVDLSRRQGLQLFFT
ncbi:fungal-specific transcription factor domain-containing protein [Zalerion maritima]|uniref:Fungal-specific transcription factor domain-containing protein n=1 Tax=Zalerion maritima TaxID=339359 RepID=A0AAD5RUV5_9PEZI|nr:fungal-specific transcription factor domain-containing protein [Zalerion maritima]